MPWSGSGSFTRVYSWVADALASIDINATRMDADTNDITSNGFGNCLTRDGQGIATANLPMGGFRHTGVGNGVAASDYASLGQLQNALVNWVAAGGTHDAITATYSPAVTTLTDGMVLFVRATAANLTTTPTFIPNGVGSPLTITKNGGQALAVGDIPGNLAEIALRYNLANTRWELLNPPDVPIGGAVPYFGGTVPAGFALPQGQNLSAATYPAANVVLGTTYGSPGGGNFTMPDLRGRYFANLDAGGSGRITVAGGNFDGTTLGTAGGQQNRTVAQANLPNVNFTNSGIAISDSHNHADPGGGSFATSGGSDGSPFGVQAGSSLTFRFTANTSTVSPGSVSAQGSAASGGSGTALATLPPTLMINVMMRIA